METRKNQLNIVSDFIADADSQVNRLLANFGWKRTETNLKRQQQNEKKATAPDSDALPESFYDEHHPFSVKVDKNVQAYLLSAVHCNLPVERETPTNHEDLLVNYSSAERLTLDQYVLQNTPAIEPLQEIQISFQKQNRDAKMTSLADIATYRRNVFRRNQKYRVAKNPLTYQEEVRNLIQMQTEAMVEYLGQVKREKSPRREDGGRDKRKREDKRDRERSRGKSYEGSHRKRSKYD